MAHQIDDVAEIVFEADALYGVVADPLTVLPAQPNRTADAGVVAIVFRKR